MIFLLRFHSFIQEYHKVNLIYMSYFLANVNFNGKHLKQIIKINIPQHLLIVHCGNSV